MSGSDGPKKIGDLLSQVLARHGYGQMTIRLELEQAWRKVAGDSARNRTRVGSLRRGVLEILVDNSTLLQELESFQKYTLLEQMKSAVQHSRIESLRFRRM